MPKRRMSIILRGQFTHVEYRRLCDALDEVGDVYSSMGSEERTATVSTIYLNTCRDEHDLETLIRERMSVDNLKIIPEEAHAENCN